MDKARLQFLKTYLENYTGQDLLAPLIQGGFEVSELMELGYDYLDIMVAWAELYNEGEFDHILKEEQ
jgi:hypothetical protein